MKKQLLYASLLCAAFNPLAAQELLDFYHPALHSFEESTLPALPVGKSSSLTLTQEHYKHGKTSLLWKWSEPRAQLSFKQPIDFLFKNPDPFNTAVSSFVFWIYQKQPLRGETIRFEFLKEGRVCSWFDYGNDFQGWRGAWVAFQRDMQGTPEEGMDEMRITAPNTPKGELMLDHLILGSFQDVRHHTADFQAPFINAETDSHWLILLNSWKNQFEYPITASISQKEIKEIQQVEENLTQLMMKKPKESLESIREKFAHYQIRENGDGTVTGMPIHFIRYAETYINLGYKYPGDLYTKDKRTLAMFNDLMYQIAITYNNSENSEERNELASLFTLGTRHLLDQGWAAGSAQGSLHHLGYSVRTYYPAYFLMREPLREAGLRHQVQQAMEWFAGTGEVKLRPTFKGIDIDAFNTSLIGRILSILMMEDTPEKSTYLAAFSQWVDNGLKHSDGTAACFKIDGSIQHHRHNYPAYAIGGLDNAVLAVFFLRGGDYAISQESHENLKKALLTMRSYCNLTDWPLSLSGRHPRTTGNSLIPGHFSQLAMAGTPDGSEAIDRELAEAYLRLAQFRTDSDRETLLQKGFTPEAAPSGNYTLPYSNLAVHRRDNWMVTAQGHSRYLWATETYVSANLYGRYLNHGNLLIMPYAAEKGREAAGYMQEGWNWNHFPGTTAAVRPIQELRADVRNVDSFSGYEEMLISDESFAGALTAEGLNGLYAMKLHEHDKYNGSLRARKSNFFFDNRIVSLGSDIESKLKEAPVMTTLFQIHLPNTEEAIAINGESIHAFPYQKRVTGKFNWLSDTKENHFYVRNGDVEVTRSLQHSFDQANDKPTQNNFALAAINHGETPHKGAYEYLVLVQPKPLEAEEMAKTLNSKSAPYRVLQCDSLAHIVLDYATQSTGYALFEAGKISVPGTLRFISLPALAMTRRVDSKQLVLSIADPDLHFYEGPADEKFSDDGKRIERSVYSRSWINNPSAESNIRVTLDGAWTLEPSEYATVVSQTKKETILEVKCQHGFTRDLNLRKN